jgi:hypothetical protein
LPVVTQNFNLNYSAEDLNSLGFYIDNDKDNNQKCLSIFNNTKKATVFNSYKTNNLVFDTFPIKNGDTNGMVIA